jgi:hypothetical protein
MCYSFYNRVEVLLEEKNSRGPDGLQNLHTLLSLLGLGTALYPSRPEDEERMKIFILLHAFCPALSYVMERDPTNYHISISELREKIPQAQKELREKTPEVQGEAEAEPILKKYLDEHPELLVKEEMYSGRYTYCISDMGDQVRRHVCGLLFGMKYDMEELLENEEGKKEMREIISKYVEKLKNGVARDSNREAYVCRGEVTGGQVQ